MHITFSTTIKFKKCGYTFKGGNSGKTSPFWKGVYPQRKEYAPMGAHKTFCKGGYSQKKQFAPIRRFWYAETQISCKSCLPCKDVVLIKHITHVHNMRKKNIYDKKVFT